MWLGITEYLFRNDELLEEVIETAIEDNTFRADDLEFTFAARVCLLSILPMSMCISTDLSSRTGALESALATSKVTARSSRKYRNTSRHASLRRRGLVTR
jgi:hypothetical protein